MDHQAAKEGIISFDGYRVFKLDFKCEPNYNQESVPNGKFTYNFSYGVVDLQDGVVQVNLLVVAYFGNDDINAENSPFTITVEIGGKFAASDRDEWNHQWDANAIAILYPYVRGIISSVSSQAGVNTVVLPTINVAAMLLDNNKN